MSADLAVHGVGTTITVRAVEQQGKPPVITLVDDTPDWHGPGEFVVMEYVGKKGWVEIARFGDPQEDS